MLDSVFENIGTGLNSIPEKWTEGIFSDFIDINPHISLKRNNEYSFIEMKDLDASKRFVYPSIRRELTGGARFQNGDTLFARITPCLENGKICQAKGLLNNMGFGSTEFLVFRGKDGLSYNDYVYYLCRTATVRDYAEKHMSGTSGRQRVTKEAFNNLKIAFPPLQEQKVIADILSSLDHRIELNNKMNETLEQIAQAIFKRWFIEFEFPDENGNPYKSGGGEIVDSELGELPKSWEVKTLGSSVRIKRGGSPRPIHKFIAETGYRWLKISDVTGLNSPFVFNIKEHIKFEGVKGTVLLKAGSLILSNSATPGIPKILAVDSCIHDGWLYFPESYFSNEYLYLLFMSIKPKLIKQGNGSVFTNLKTDILKEWMVSVPDETILSRFQEFIKPLFDQMFFCTNQQNILLQLRDSLLPKLITGKIRVPLNTEEENEARKT